MTDLRPPPWESVERRSRRRALWALGSLAVAAILVVTLMTVYLHSGNSQPQARPTVLFQEPSGATPTSAPAHASSSARPSSPSAAPSSSPTGRPCPGSTPCAVAGDAGNALAAVNAFRAAHGAAQVSGSATADAAACALSQGDGPTCRPHYAWEAVPTQDGNQVVSAIGSRDDGWLLDPAMTSFSVGWAFVPSSGSGQWFCAILKTG